ncbi:MAG: histidine ammonia-lyase [Actinomycetota bacterium]
MTVLIGEPLDIDGVVAVAGGEPVELASGLADDMAPARRIVEEAVDSGVAVYGITTGLGDLASVRIDSAEAKSLQEAILRSHGTAVGPPLPTEVVRAMMLLKARTFAMGVSGVRFALVERLARMLNESIHPVVPSQGSLGASGDLALLAHLALPLIGEGTVEVEGEILPAAEALRAAGLEALELSHKEGLSLVNGTEGMLALGVLTCARAATIARAADVTGAMSVEACFGTNRVFDEEVVGLRTHPGALQVADNLRRLLSGSNIVVSHRHSDHLVQDAYSLRCIPQVHGAYRDGIAYARTTFERELASAIDNPNVIASTGEVRSGGNFHGESLALALDHLALCLAGFATIAERRVARLVDPNLNNGLPAFLTAEPGVRTGFMIVQYTAASVVSESRSLLFPASADSIPTSAGQEDHVSMGATAGRKAMAIASNTENVIAMEALASAQGIDLRAPLTPSAATGHVLEHLRAVSPVVDEDRPLSNDIAAVRTMVAGGHLSAAAEEVVGPLG